MSTKIKASSKGQKAMPKKALKKSSPKKAIALKKKATPTAKKAASSSPVSKIKSKPVKKAAPAKKQLKANPKNAKPVKKAVVKKAAQVVKKAALKKPVKTSLKKQPEAAAPKKAPSFSTTNKLTKPTATVKTPLVKKPVKDLKPNPKPQPVKATEPEVVMAKPVKTPKPAKVKPVAVKKPLVAPTTFRQADTAPVKFIKEPEGKFEMEFVIRASEDMVFEFVSTESGLSEWFCDDVTIRNGIFTFSWEGQQQQAKLVKEIPPTFIRYQWVDKNDGSYFEFRTQKDELTNDISLIITDFASDKSEEESARLLWHSQIDKLLHVLGSFF